MDTPRPIAIDADAEPSDEVPHALPGEEDLPADARDAVARRLDAWRPNYRLATDEDVWLFERMVIASVLLDRRHAAIEALQLEEQACAGESWDDDRRAEAEDLSKGLARRPEVVARQLERTKHGAEWLIEKWRILGTVLDRGESWTKKLEQRVHDLLGTPRDLRDAVPLPEPADRPALVAREIERLEARRRGALDAQDERCRRAAVAGQPLTVSKAMQALCRKESACERRYQWAANRLRGCRLTPETAPEPEAERTRRDSAPEGVKPPTPALTRADVVQIVRRAVPWGGSTIAAPPSQVVIDDMGWPTKFTGIRRNPANFVLEQT